MPSSEHSLELTDEYREQLRQERLRAVAAVGASWALLNEEDLDRSFKSWLPVAAASINAAQRIGISQMGEYVGNFLLSEIGRRADLAASRRRDRYVGVDPFGRPLVRALAPPVVTVKMAIASGRAIDEALELGRQRAMRIAAAAIAASPRAALADEVQANDAITGWRRAPRGILSCGACLALADGRIHRLADEFDQHTNCDCVAELVIAGARDRVRRPTGKQIFDSMTREQQDAMFEGRGGAEKAKLLRSGKITLRDLVTRDEQALGPGVVTETPLAALT